ncbi:two-component signal transduction sensor histidine kinase [Gottschalkia acidurici 9a]|uniref:Two-component signal transduction sensor histidine kinase n=1 Tax=Gottschalkia acidurici (strain ATCC 7906 / DSM 604 / BCRC 14475 / CIP 104303 / KCTC 5404 / NCIMB 10678 / 9a) TaxID=1128398 RepID=K0AWN9_GOTA9|nr:ATP-binding protein [Gottschalkia acidurici]AFS77145.1 two-component signal transduction sensor histidine kinase [Gottschalkia acidurici 9a]
MLNGLPWGIVTVISVSIEWLVFNFILNKISILKKDKITLYVSLSTLILIITTFSFLKMESNIKLFIGMILGFVFYIFNYEVTTLKSTIVSLVYWMLFLGIDIISASIVTIINSMHDLNKLLDENIFRLELIIISKLFLLFLTFIFRKFNLKRVQLNIKKRELVYVGIPIITNIVSIIAIFIYSFKQEESNFIQNIIMFIMSSLLLLSNISLVIIVYRIMKDSKLRIENKIIKEKINTKYEYYLKLQDNQMKVRKLYHDIKNHIICIQNIHINDDTIEKYIDSINKEISSCADIYKTGNMILDIILNEKKSICDKNSIEFISDINFSMCDFIDMVDVCSIFSNILDNAIEACEKIDSKTIVKYIKIRGTIVNKFFVLKVENSKINNVIMKGNKVITDKRDSFLHGLGIISIKSSVEKYNGEIAIEHKKDKFIMNIYIPLQ